MKDEMALICSLQMGVAPTTREEGPVPHTPPDRVKGRHSPVSRGSSSGTGMGKHGAELSQCESHMAPVLKATSLGVPEARSMSWSRNCPIYRGREGGEGGGGGRSEKWSEVLS